MVAAAERYKLGCRYNRFDRFTQGRTLTMGKYPDRIKRAKAAVAGAGRIIIGAGAGLSTAAGLEYGGERFRSHFGDFIEKYGVSDMYSAAFYPFETQEERWAYFARHIAINRFDVPPLPLYSKLLDLVKDEEYFVITTNVDAQFQKAGFDRSRLFATQGDYGTIQCRNACHDGLYDDEELVRNLQANTADCRVPSSLVPVCPVCGGEMTPHLRVDGNFVEDARWREMSANYMRFVDSSDGEKLVLLEIGVGYNTPGIIRYPFEQLTYLKPDVTLVRINRDAPQGAPENRDRTIAFTEDAKIVIEELLR